MRSAGGRAGVDSGQRQLGRLSRWMPVAALAYVVMLAVVTLLPIHWTLGLLREPPNYEPKLVPFGGIRGNVQNSPVEALAELVGNVLLFAPLGFLLPLLVRAMHRWWRVLAASAAVSLAIELCQLAWPGVRTTSVNDVLTNALGALLGFAALRLTEALRGRRLRWAGRQGRRRPGGRLPRPLMAGHECAVRHRDGWGEQHGWPGRGRSPRPPQSPLEHGQDLDGRHSARVTAGASR